MRNFPKSSSRRLISFSILSAAAIVVTIGVCRSRTSLLQFPSLSHLPGSIIKRAGLFPIEEGGGSSVKELFGHELSRFKADLSLPKPAQGQERSKNSDSALDQPRETILRLIGKPNTALTQDQVQGLLSFKDELTRVGKFNLVQLGALCLGKGEFRWLMEVLKAYGDGQEISGFLTAAYQASHGEVWILDLAGYNQLDIFSEVLETSEAFLPKERFVVLLKTLGGRGWNLAHRIAANPNLSKEHFDLVMQTFKRYMEQSEMEWLLTALDQSGQTILHLAATFNQRQILPAALSSAKEILPPEAFQKLLTAVDRFGCNFLHDAAQYQPRNGFADLVEYLQGALGKEALQELFTAASKQHGFTLLHLAALNDQPVLPEMLSAAKKRLTDEAFQKLLTSVDRLGCNFLHFAAQYQPRNGFADLAEYLQRTLGKEAIQGLFTAVDKGGYTVFHSASSNKQPALPEVISVAKEILAPEAFQNLLTSLDNSEHTFLTRAARFQSSSSFAELVEQLQQSLEKKAIQGLFTAVDEDGWTLFHSASLNKQPVLPQVISAAKETLAPEAFQKLLTSVDTLGGNFLHCAVRCQSQKDFSDLVGYLQHTLEKEAIQGLFTATNENGFTVFHCAPMNKHLILPEVISAAKEILAPEAFQKLLTSGDSFGCNFLQRAAQYPPQSGFAALVEQLEQILEKEAIQGLFTAADKDGFTLFHLTFFDDRSQSALPEVISAAKELLAPEAFQKLLTSGDRLGRNFLHCAVRCQSQKGFSDLVGYLQCTLEKGAIQALFTAVDQDGRTLFHLATLNDQPVLPQVISASKETLSPEAFQKLLTSVDKLGGNFLHYAVRYQSQNGFADLVEYLQQILEKEAIQRLFTAADEEGYTLFHSASLNKQPALPGVISAAKELLAPEAFQKLLTSVDAVGENFLNTALIHQPKAELGALVGSLRTELRKEELELLLSSSKAAPYAGPGILEALRGYLTEEEIEKLTSDPPSGRHGNG